MINHLNQNRISNFRKVLSHADGAEAEIKRIVRYSDGTSEQVYPNPALNLRIETNYDNSMLTKIDPDFSAVYPVPVINGSEEKCEPLKITVRPFPENAGWRISSSSNFDCSAYADQIHYGSKTLIFDVPVPTQYGYEKYRLTFTPEHESCESQVFSFYGIKYAASDLTPSAWWSFDDSNLADKVSGFTFEQTKKNPETVYEGSEFTDGIGNGKALRAVESIDGDCNFYTFPYTPAWYNDKSGISLALSGKFKRHGTVGFSDPTTDNFTDGHHFAISWDYAQPKCALPLGAATTKPETTAKDRVDYNWHHLALTMTEVLNPKTDSRFIVDYSQNEYGTITYVSSDVNYSETLTNTKYVDYFNGFKIRLAKFYIDGVLQGESLVKARLTGGTEDQSAVPLGRGMFSISFLNNADASSATPDVVDEIKVFSGVLSLSDIRKECSLIGLTFDDDGGTGNTRPELVERNGRTRIKPADQTNIDLAPHMKVFLIDNRTIAVGCCFREAIIQQLKTEFPNLDAVETNFRNGYVQAWQRTFYYMYDLWDLYRDYVPMLVDRLDLAENWKVDGKEPVMLGRWQNSTGQMYNPDALDGTDFVKADVADIVHFAYLQLPEGMAEGSTHQVSWFGHTVEFTYGKEHYCSSIKVNQEGYSPEAGRKYAYWGQWLGTGGTHTVNSVVAGKPFYIVDSKSGTTVFTGTIKERNAGDSHSAEGVTYQLTGEKVFELDFSNFNTEGTYQIYIPDVGYSHVFEIGNNALGRAFYTHSRALFHHRSGCGEVRKPFTNWEYSGIAHGITFESNFICDDGDYKSCTTSDGQTYDTIFPNKHFSMIPNNATGRVFRDVKGGWFDAADFDRRPYHFIVVKDLIEAYIHFPQNFSDGQLNIPESGNSIPDILSEAEWGLDVWRKAQTPEGGIAAWIETKQHEADWPWRSELKYYIGTPNRKDSLEYAQCAAKLARALQMVGNDVALKKAAVYTESAIRAFNFGINPENAAEFVFHQVDSNNEGYDFSYKENSQRADIYIVLAAASLFALTKEPRFGKYINAENYNLHYSAMNYDENTWAVKICTELVLGELEEYFPAFTQRERDLVLSRAERWYEYQELQAYHEMNWPPNHAYFFYTSWGAGHPEARGRSFIWAWLITKDRKYKDAAFLIMDNVMGCNCMGRTGTSGVGKVAPVKFLDSWLPRAELELGVYEPVPGISPYGIVGFDTAAVPYGFRLTKDARNDMSFEALGINILPAGFSKSVANTRGSVAVWLQGKWPIWRNIFELQDNHVAQSEFTIFETISGKAFMTGCLMEPGFMPDEALKNREPGKNKYAVEGLIYLP